MKKLFTLCLFTMALFLGTQNISAQDYTKSPEAIAKEKTYKLSQEFGLDGNQQRLIWRAFLEREKAKQDIAKGTFSDEEVKNIQVKVDNSFHTSMEKHLNAQQYAKFKIIMKEYL